MKYLDYPEQQKHGDQDFPYFFYHVSHLHPRYEMPYHWHPLWEIVHVRSGHFKLHLDHNDIFLSPGDTAFVSPGVIHGGTPVESKTCCYECLLLDTDTIFSPVSFRIYERQLLDVLKQRVTVTNFFPASEKEINQIFVEMLDCMRDRPKGYTLQIQGLTFFLFGIILQKQYFNMENPGRYQRKNLQFKTVMAYIDGHYQEAIGLRELAACVNMTPNYFCRYFKEMIHRTPTDYLNYYRIEAACERLSYTDKSITEVAYECGFQDASYFVKVFKRYKHMTPSEYTHAAF